MMQLFTHTYSFFIWDVKGDEGFLNNCIAIFHYYLLLLVYFIFI